MRRRAIAMTAAGATAVGMLAAMAPATAAPADGATKPFVVLMAAEPALGYDGGTAGIPATQPAKGRKINPNAANVKKYRDHLKKSQAQALKSVGIDAAPRAQLTVAANGFAVSLTEAEADRLALAKDVLVVQEDVLKQKQTDISPSFLGLDGTKESWASGYTGKGVVVGVIDTGIWPEHPSFADPGGLPAHDVEVPCEFGDTAHNTLDKPFQCQNKLIGARDMRITYKQFQGPEVYNSARDYDGHGTHVASTAAGNRNVTAEIFGINRGTVSGVAPQAGVIAYSALGDLGGYGSDLAAAIDQAVLDGVDVINYSVGSSTPSIGPDDIAFLYAADAGVFVATSNGNAGPNPSTTGSPAHVPWLTAVGASTTPRTFEATATLGNGTTYVGASITEGLNGSARLVDSAAHDNPLCLTNRPFTPSVTGAVVLCARGENPRVDKSEAVKNAGGVGMILYNQNDAQALVTDNHWIPSVHIRYSEGIAIKEYIASAGAEATASLTQGVKASAQGNVMADFSSRGPVGSPGDPNIIRPDVTAPGVNILAGNTPTPGSGRPGQLFQSISGTSMSSPHVAGLFALIKQAHPDWSASAAKSALMTTARQNVVKEDGTTPADPFDFGAGHVDPGQPGKRGSMFDPGVAFEAGFTDYLAYICGPYSSLLTAATCTNLEAAGYSNDPSNLNVPSIGIAEVAGSHTVQRTLTNVTGQPLNMRAEVQAPAGYTVKVSPERVMIRPGQKATVDVTVTNASAPVGAWRFGAITWKGAGYDARIPIAVAGASIKAPAEVMHTGAAGSGSVEVTFGYTGAFSVESYGLADETATSGSVAQDPNASFAPSDVANGGATRHDFTLSGEKLWRIALTDADLTRPGQDVDLDLYLFNATTGQLVGSSGAGGTEELIELVDPAAGDYALYVHGWGTSGGPVGYTVRSWAVGGAADPGTLQVTSAPSSATVAQTGTVEYSWSDVAAGTSELGLLVYSDGNGEIGRTLVTVQN